MNSYCSKAILCDAGKQTLGYDFPVANFSSELPDQAIFIGVGYGWDNNTAPLGKIWSTQGCVAWCTSTTSQEEADLCAEVQQFKCQNNIVPNTHPNPADPTVTPPAPGPVPGTNPTLYGNHPQTCSYTCPDGTVFHETVDGGNVVAQGQALADQIAHSVACNNLNKKVICSNSLNGFACADPFLVNSEYSFTFTSTTTAPPLIWSVASGSLPTGLTLEQNGQMHGFPTVAGDYNFTVRSTNANGNTVDKACSFHVMGLKLNSPDLPEATVDQPYNYQLPAGGGATTFSITDGSLPTGITMDSGGHITGTCPSLIGSSFTVQVEDEFFNGCSYDLFLNVHGPKFLNTPPNPTQCTPYNFQMLASPSGCTFSGSCPAGMKISGTGLITGCPASPGAGAFALTANDGTHTNTLNANVVVAANPPVSGYATAIQDMPWAAPAPYDFNEGHSSSTAVGGNVDYLGTIGKTSGSGDGQAGENRKVATGLQVCGCQAVYDILVTINWTVVSPGPNTPGGHIQVAIGTANYHLPSFSTSGSHSFTLLAANWAGGSIIGTDISYDVVFFSDFNDGEKLSFSMSIRFTPIAPPP